MSENHSDSNDTNTCKKITESRIVKYLLGYTEADLGISAVIILVSTIGMTVAFILFAAEQTRLLQLEFINVGFHNPKFFEDVRGIAGFSDVALSYTQPTSNYVMYEMMRQNVFPIGAILIFAYIMFNAWGEASGMFGKGATKPMFLKFMGMIILVAIFVPVWDLAAISIEEYSIIMLNPMYSHETADKCREDPDKVMILVAAQNQEIYENLEQTTFGWNDQSICSPHLRIAYVYQKAFSGATVDLDEDVIGFDRVLTDFANIGQIIATTIFMGMTKTMLLFSVTLMGLIVMTIRELLLAVIISLLPLFVLLAFVPKVGSIFGKLLETILPLLLVPVITAAVFLTGSGILLDMEAGFSTGERSGNDRFTFWIAAVSILLLATGIPVLMAPILSGLAGQASSLIGTAVLSGAMGAMSAIRGAASGTAAGAQGVMGSNSKLASMAGVKGILQGMGHGLGMGASAGMMSDASVAAGSVPGGAGVASPFSKGSKTVEGYAGSGPGGGFDPQASALAGGNAAAAAAKAQGGGGGEFTSRMPTGGKTLTSNNGGGDGGSGNNGRAEDSAAANSPDGELGALQSTNGLPGGGGPADLYGIGDNIATKTGEAAKDGAAGAVKNAMPGRIMQNNGRSDE